MNTHRLLGTIAGVGALAAALLGNSSPAIPRLDATTLATEIEHEADHVTALELAEWIRARKSGLRVIDVRPDSDFVSYHIPSAERIPLPALATLKPGSGETLVLYSGGGAHAAQGWVLLRASGHQRVYFLRGGLLEWMDDVMNPVLPPRRGTNMKADSVVDYIGGLSRYFGGVPRTGAVPLPSLHDNERDVGSAIAKAKRRGC